MPSSVADIFEAASLRPAGVVRWGEAPSPPPSGEPSTGIYVVALTDRTGTLDGVLSTAPLSSVAVDELLDARPELTLDGRRATTQTVIERLSSFWLPDEVVLYIGLAGPRRNQPPEGEVSKRVKEYYATPLGARSPHSGGWPLKTIDRLQDLYVHFAYCHRVTEAERECLGHFAARVSVTSLALLRDQVRVMPFANLEFPKGNPKNHGFRGARGPRARESIVGARGAEPASSERIAPAAQPSVSAGLVAPIAARYRSQRVTAKDIEVGQVRIPADTKTLFPGTRTQVVVELRGHMLECRWDPRLGERERSGVLRVGKRAATDLLSPDDVLAVAAGAGSLVRLD
jgi:hypothetical protein